MNVYHDQSNPLKIIFLCTALNHPPSGIPLTIRKIGKHLRNIHTHFRCNSNQWLKIEVRPQRQVCLSALNQSLSCPQYYNLFICTGFASPGFVMGITGQLRPKSPKSLPLVYRKRKICTGSRSRNSTQRKSSILNNQDAVRKFLSNASFPI